MIGGSYGTLETKRNGTETKKWVAKNPEKTDISSYHISQYMVPWISAEKINSKRLGSNPRYFVNEVEGSWYKGARKPLTDPDIRALFYPSVSMLEPDQINQDLGPLYLGVDWGGGTRSHTVVWIWQLLDPDIPFFRLVYLLRIDEKSTEKQAEIVARLVDMYDITQGVMDGGGGPYQVQKIEELFAGKMIKCSYTTRPEKPFEVKSEENSVTIDRTWMIETIIDLITRFGSYDGRGFSRILVPAMQKDKVEWIIDDFTSIESESVTLASGKNYVRYGIPRGRNDDALHACIYAYIAWLVSKSLRWYWISA